MRILITGGTAVSRRALITLLKTRPGLEIVGEAAHVSQLVTLFTQTVPDMVLLNGSVDDESGADVIQAIRVLAPQTAVLVLCARQNLKDEMLAAGADAFVFKGNPPKSLLTTIEAIRVRRDDV